jgi:hypothetical protein
VATEVGRQSNRYTLEIPSIQKEAVPKLKTSKLNMEYYIARLRATKFTIHFYIIIPRADRSTDLRSTLSITYNESIAIIGSSTYTERGIYFLDYLVVR